MIKKSRGESAREMKVGRVKNRNEVRETKEREGKRSEEGTIKIRINVV